MKIKFSADSGFHLGRVYCTFYIFRALCNTRTSTTTNSQESSWRITDSPNLPPMSDEIEVNPQDEGWFQNTKGTMF